MSVRPGIYGEIPAEAYYADALNEQPTLNASVLKLLLKASPRHAWTAHPKLNPEYAPKVAAKFDVGLAAHEVFLLGNDDRVFVLPPQFKDWRKDEAQEVRARARAEGMVPLLAHQWQDVSVMLTALREQLPGLDVDPPMFVEGKAEQTLVWRDQGVLCRARIDWLHGSLQAVDDLKTCSGSASPLVWASRTLWGMQAEIQAAFTIRGIEAVSGVKPEFRFLACETHPPYAISPVRLGPRAVEFANEQIDRGLELWKRCLKEDRWPSYPARIVDADPPSWMLWEASDLEDIAEAAA
jgi:hypothetical protein